MAIKFSCDSCGEPFAVGDRFAGRKTKCPTCLAPLVVPTPAAPPPEPVPVPSPTARPAAAGASRPPAPTAFDDFELVDDAGSEDETVLDAVEVGPAEASKTTVVEPPRGKKTPAEPTPARTDDTPAEPAKPKKKKKRKPSPESGLAAMYMQEARAQEERDAARSAGGRGEKGQGLTIGGVHITGGVLAGAGMLLSGLLAMLVIFLFQDQIRSWRPFYVAIAGTFGGAVTLFRALVLGEED